MQLSEGSSIALSDSSQSHRFNICVDQYVNNEVKMRVVSNINKNLQSKMPKRDFGSQIQQTGLTNRAKSKIRLAARILHHNLKHKKASFMTLTYGSNVPPDHVAKSQLDTMLKRLRRRYGNFLYLWVAENQQRGAIHFHIALNLYIPKEEINEDWNDIVNKWLRKENYNEQKLYPHIEGVESIGNYVSKYISKKSVNNKDEKDDTLLDDNGNMARTFICGNLYGISMELRKLMKPVRSASYQIDAEQIRFEDLCNDIFIPCSNILNHKNDRAILHTYSTYSNGGIWLSDVNVFRFFDFVNFELPIIKSIFEGEKYEYARAG